MHQAPGTREAEIAKVILPIAFCTHSRHGGRLGEDVVSIPRGENENLMRNKLRALNWFRQALSDDLWVFASKQCAFNQTVEKQPSTPSVPVSCRDGWGLATPRSRGSATDWENGRRTVTANRLVFRIVDEERVVYSCAGPYQ